ncbi:MAG: hypothetical protein ACT4PL_06670 [Phycisphaerales bacterium]
MSSAPVRPGQLSEETLAALAERATATARRNQPRVLIAAALAFMGVAFIVLIYAFVDRQDTASRLEQETTLTVTTNDLVDRILAVRAKEQELLGNRTLDKSETMYTEIERLGREAGLKDLRVSEGADPTAGAATDSYTRRKYSAVLSKQETEHILKWIARVTAELKGVEVSQIEFEPDTATVEGKPRWKGSVAFTRWERK